MLSRYNNLTLPSVFAPNPQPLSFPCTAVISFVPAPPAWRFQFSAALPGPSPRQNRCASASSAAAGMANRSAALLQVAPIEIVSLCDVDQAMLNAAVKLIAERKASKQRPRTYPDYRKMLAEKDLDIVLIATPDHWHALPMIAAVEAGADVYLQKPISVDVMEGQAMLAAARKHGRVVQVGTQRRSTPHLIEARDRIVREASWAAWAWSKSIATTTCGPATIRPTRGRPTISTTKCGPVPRRCGRTIRSSIRGAGGTSWNTATASSATCACTCSMRSAGCSTSVGRSASVPPAGFSSAKGSKANISDTQTATFEYGDLDIVWQHRTWGPPPDPEYPWGMTIYGDKGTLKASVMSYDFTPEGPGESIHRDVTYEREHYPEDVTEKDIEIHVAPAIRRHMQDFCRHRVPRPARGRHRAGTHFHGQLHPGEPLHAAWPLTGLGRRKVPRAGRRRSQPPPASALPRAVGASGGWMNWRYRA